MNFYEILGVGRDATYRDIRQAYRSKSKACHPDAGGSREEFEQLQLAYSTLSDEGARDYYDSTGKTKEKEIDVSVEIIISLLDNLIESDAPMHIDYVAVLKGSVKAIYEELEKIIAEDETKRKKLQKLLRKFVSKKSRGKEGSPNLLSDIIKQKITNIDDSIAKTKRKLVDTQRAAALLDECAFLPDTHPGDGEFTMKRRFTFDSLRKARYNDTL